MHSQQRQHIPRKFFGLTVWEMGCRTLTSVKEGMVIMLSKFIHYFIKSTLPKPAPGIKITGPEWFQNRINMALKILKEKDTESFEMVNLYLDKVTYDEYMNSKIFAEVSSIGARESFFGKSSKNCDIYRLISSLYHEAYHCKLTNSNCLIARRKRGLHIYIATRNMLVKIKAPIKSVHRIDLFLSVPNWWNNYPTIYDNAYF